MSSTGRKIVNHPSGLFGHEWVQCQRCFWVWDERDEEHTVCGCFDKYGTRTVVEVLPSMVQELVNRGFDRG